MFTLRDDAAVDLDALIALRARCGFTAYPRDTLAAQLAGSRWLVHVYAADAAGTQARLVGFARAISDGTSTAYVSAVMVDPDARRQGIGRRMLEHLMHGRDAIKFVLHTRPDAAAFYAALGFAPASHMLVRERR